MRSRDQLLRDIRERVHHPATARELVRVLDIPREERTSFKRQLKSLVSDGELIMVREPWRVMNPDFPHKPWKDVKEDAIEPAGFDR